MALRAALGHDGDEPPRALLGQRLETFDQFGGGHREVGHDERDLEREAFLREIDDDVLDRLAR
jgi:hypothetical protein